jgi:hypothetical protein
MSAFHRCLLAGALTFLVGACDSSSDTPRDAAAAPQSADGVCAQAAYWPNDTVAFGGTGCILWSCDSGIAWKCATSDADIACGARPAQGYDGCLQWSCSAGHGWHGQWLCADPAVCPLAAKPGADCHGCYCDLKKGGWVCASPGPACSPPPTGPAPDAGPDFATLVIDGG